MNLFGLSSAKLRLPAPGEALPGRAAPPFHFAEDWHRQYLDANPNGYCGLRGTGVACAIGAEDGA